MLFGLILLIYSIMSDPVEAAIESYGKIESYSVTLRSSNDEGKEEIKYHYMKPGFVKMEFVEPHKGAVLVYNPETRKVKLKPFHFLSTFILDLDPDSRLIRSSKGHTVDSSDIGALLERVKELKNAGGAETVAEEEIRGRKAVKVIVDGRGAITKDGVGSYQLWLDTDTAMPLKVISYGAGGEVIEEVLMDDIEVNLGLARSFFMIG